MPKRHNLEDMLKWSPFGVIDSNNEVRMYNIGTDATPGWLYGAGNTASPPADGSEGWATGAQYIARTAAGHSIRKPSTNIGTGTSCNFDFS